MGELTALTRPLTGGKGLAVPSQEPPPLSAASLGPLWASMEPPPRPYRLSPLNRKVKLRLSARITITCKGRKSRDCAACDIGLYAGPELNTLSDGDAIDVIYVFHYCDHKSILFSLKCTRNCLAAGLRPDSLGSLSASQTIAVLGSP